MGAVNTGLALGLLWLVLGSSLLSRKGARRRTLSLARWSRMYWRILVSDHPVNLKGSSGVSSKREPSITAIWELPTAGSSA